MTEHVHKIMLPHVVTISVTLDASGEIDAAEKGWRLTNDVIANNEGIVVHAAVVQKVEK